MGRRAWRALPPSGVNDVQASPTYPGGLALRFARVKRYRTDKSADQADTIERVREIHRRTAEALPSATRG